MITRALAEHPDLQPEDYGVLSRLMLRAPQAPSDVRALTAEFRAGGWKMGVERLAAVIKRLEDAGLISYQASYDPGTRRPRWRISMSGRPAPVQPVRPRRRDSPAVKTKGWAYAVREPQSGRIKIGRSSNPQARLSALQTGSATALDLLWMAQGGSELELYLHERFADRRLHGEWFDFSDSQAEVLIQQAAADFVGRQ